MNVSILLPVLLGMALSMIQNTSPAASSCPSQPVVQQETGLGG